MSSRVSPDGLYYWDGTTWASTLSADGRHRWNGTAWVPMTSAPYIAASGYGATPSRQPTSWTRPLQFAVAGWYVWSILYSLAIPWLMNGFTSQFLNQYIAAQEARNPDFAPPPAGFVDQMNTMMQVGMWIGVAILIAIYAVPLIGAWRRWIWIFYTVLILLGLSALLLPLDLFDAAIGTRLATASSLAMPQWFYVINFLTGLPGAALFVWMLLAMFTRGPWAMRRVSY